MISKETILQFNNTFRNYRLKKSENNTCYMLLNKDNLNLVEFIDICDPRLEDYKGFIEYVQNIINDKAIDLLDLNNRQKQRISFNAADRASAKNISKKNLVECLPNMISIVFVYPNINQIPISDIELYELSEKYQSTIYMANQDSNFIDKLYEFLGLGFCIFQKYKKIDVNLSKSIQDEVNNILEKEIRELLKNVSVFYNNEKYDMNLMNIDEAMEDILDTRFPYRIDNIIKDDFAYKTLKQREFVAYATKTMAPSSRVAKFDLYELKTKSSVYRKLYNLLYFKLEHLYKDKFYFDLYDFLVLLINPPYGIMFRNIECFEVAEVILDFLKNNHYIIANKTLLKLRTEEGVKSALFFFTASLDSDKKNRNSNFPCWKFTTEYQNTIGILSNIFQLDNVYDISSFILRASDQFRKYMYPFRFLEDYFLKNEQNKCAQITRLIVEICSDCNNDNIIDSFYNLINLVSSDFNWRGYKKSINNNNLLNGMCSYIGCKTQEFIEKSDLYDWGHYSIKTLWNKEFFKEVFYE